MPLEIVRRVRGNLHGTIDVSPLENAIIDHPYVQRLRRIQQTAFLSFVFPGATHSRFEHSLGVMHLAGEAWEKLRINQRRLQESLAHHGDFARAERLGNAQHGLLSPTFTLMDNVFTSDYNLQLVRIAGLLHDVGHPPFSHSGERLLPSWTEVLKANPNLSPYLQDFLNHMMQEVSEKGRDPAKEAVRHEVFSLLMIDRILNETLERHPELKLRIDPRDVLSVIHPGVKPAPNSPVVGYGVFGLMHELLSGELDVDRMDYLLRDSQECGVVYGIFDFSRILDSLNIYFDEADQRIHLAINFSGLAAFEDYLRARQSMYLQVYYHKTGIAAEAMLQHLAKMLGDYRLPADLESYVECDETSVGPLILGAGREYLSDVFAESDFKRIVRSLFYDRRLWKMVYEVYADSKDDENNRLIEQAIQVVEDSGLAWEIISSSNFLTRLRPRGNSQTSDNSMRLIKEDARQFPRVVPIEDYAAVVGSNRRVAIHRLYVEGAREDDGSVLTPAEVRKKIIAKLGEG